MVSRDFIGKAFRPDLIADQVHAGRPAERTGARHGRIARTRPGADRRVKRYRPSCFMVSHSSDHLPVVFKGESAAMLRWIILVVVVIAPPRPRHS